MTKKIIRSIFFLTFLLIGGSVQAQRFDSVRIYPLCMKTFYRVAIGQDAIKYEVDTSILLDSKKATEAYAFFQNKVCGVKLNRKFGPGLDIRLFLEFFQNGAIARTIGVTPTQMIYIDSVIYSCNKDELKKIDYFSPNLSNMLCLD